MTWNLTEIAYRPSHGGYRIIQKSWFKYWKSIFCLLKMSLCTYMYVCLSFHGYLKKLPTKKTDLLRFFICKYLCTVLCICLCWVDYSKHQNDVENLTLLNIVETFISSVPEGKLMEVELIGVYKSGSINWEKLIGVYKSGSINLPKWLEKRELLTPIN